MRRIVLLLAALTALFCACEKTAPAPDEDDALLVIAGTELGEGEVRYLINTAVSQYALYNEIDWNGSIEGTETRSYFLDKAVDIAVTAHVTSIMAEEMGYSLTEAEESEIDYDIIAEIDYKGGREAFESAVGLTEELYRFYNYTVPLLQDKLIEGLFAEGEEYALDEQTMRGYYESHYVNVSYIFLIAAEENGEPLTGEPWETLKGVADALQRQALSGYDFFELVETHGQDYWMSDPPYRTFPLGTLESVVDEALKEMEDYEISEVITTEYGFYILKRLPTDWEWYESYKDDVWFYCASESFSERVREWRNNIEVAVGASYRQIDPQEVSAAG